MDDLLGYDEFGDDDDIGYDEIGKSGRTKAQRKRLLGPAASTSRSAGFQRLAKKRVPLGMGSVLFNFADSTDKTFEVEPQRDYQAERLILTVTKSSSSVAEQVRVTSLTVGDIEQLPAGSGVPSDCFRADAVGSEMDLSTCKGGTKLRVRLSLSDALESNESITVQAGFYGCVVGQ